jgi:hypothetical protein
MSEQDENRFRPRAIHKLSGLTFTVQKISTWL